MDSRKDQLQKQIIEALKANDNDLYSLLKSQWAHRFGVESLEELEDLDVTFSNQNYSNNDNEKDDESQNNFIEVDKEILIKDGDEKEKEIKNETNKLVKSVEVESLESFKIKSYEIVDKEKYENKTTIQNREYKSTPKVEALIPVPPKPKYSYLIKWLPRS